MKLTKSQLKNIIKEELESLISEQGVDCSSISREEYEQALRIIRQCAGSIPQDDEEDTAPTAPATAASFMAEPERLKPGIRRGSGKRVVTFAEDKK